MNSLSVKEVKVGSLLIRLQGPTFVVKTEKSVDLNGKECIWLTYLDAKKMVREIWYPDELWAISYEPLS